MTTATDITTTWVRNRADEEAAANGCVFDVEAGGIVVWWIEHYCRLYEGDQAGEPMILHGCRECGDYGLGIPEDWNDEAIAAAVERARRFVGCRDAGHFIDWQYDVTMRMFSWRKHSPRWNRMIRRFRQATIFLPKKGKKSPTIAAWGLHLTCADGEQGNKFYFGAKDGQQAREIAGKHAIEMVLSSPDLLAECTINKSLMQITHNPTRSLIKPISSADSKSQKSKEGLNGSVGLDELHVCDRDFVGRISRAGISRSEPLHIEVSTAGDDPESYGMERYNYGKLVNAQGGNEQLLFVAYEAPQDLSDEDLAADPTKWGKLANPAWGHTVGEEEYLADYSASKQSLTELGRFKMYRLNIWQQSASPWLKAGDWAKCRQDFTEADLLGRECWAGLDLSKTRDLTSLALVFPWDEHNPTGDRMARAYRLLVYFWMPEASARDRNDKAPFLQWAKSGHLELTPGSTCDYGFVRRRFRELAAKFNIRELVYDPWNAEETTQTLEMGVVAKGIEIEPGTGVPRVLFKQTIASFAGPTEEFEKLVIDGKLHHNGNPVLDWQAGHVRVIHDSNDNRRPVKPSWPKRTDADVRTIDGVIASVMGLARALQGQESWYSPSMMRN